MKESDVERAHVDRIEARGGISYKFVSPGVAGVPDRLDLEPIRVEHREIVARYVRFTECKSPIRGVISTRQAREAQRLRDLGYDVNFLNHL